MAVPRSTKGAAFAYADYLTWPPEERWELIEGTAYSMSPAPSRTHQAIVRNLLSMIAQFVEGRPCEVYGAPFDVRLADAPEASDERIDTVVQPDIVVVCDPSKLDEKGCMGAPDLIVEVMSESTAYRDLGQKLLLYARHGVREYWIVNPAGKSVTVHLRDEKEGGFGKPLFFNHTDRLNATALGGLAVGLEKAFRV